MGCGLEWGGNLSLSSRTWIPPLYWAIPEGLGSDQGCFQVSNLGQNQGEERLTKCSFRTSFDDISWKDCSMLGQFSDIEGEMEPGLFDIEFSFLQSLWTMYLQNGRLQHSTFSQLLTTEPSSGTAARTWRVSRARTKNACLNFLAYLGGKEATGCFMGPD